MKRWWVLTLVLLLVLAACGGDDEDEDTGGLVISDPWVRATIPMGDTETEMAGRTTAIFMVIKNEGDEADTLLAAAVDEAIAPVVELHETTITEDNTMQMRPVEGGIAVPANGEVELKRGGLHIMLMDVQTDLNEGDTVNVTLTFESGKEITVKAPVRPLTE